MCDLDSLHCRLQNSDFEDRIESMHPTMSYDQSRDRGQITNTHQNHTRNKKKHIVDKLNRGCTPKALVIHRPKTVMEELMR